MEYDPGREICPLPYSPFKSCTVPRPIGWLSTISQAGVANLAPYSQWQNLTFDPPMVMFAANRYPDGRVKDTVQNAQATGWFVWNMATWELRDAVNISAMALAADEDEFSHAGVTKAKSVHCAVPRVAEAPAHFECRYLSTHTLEGDSPVGTVDVVFARVERIHVADDYVDAAGKLDIAKLQPIARMGYYDYTVVRDVFEMRVPEAGDEAAAGLEGKVVR